MEISFREKNALICGGSRGIGKAVAQELAKGGCSVVIAARDEKELEIARNTLDTSEGQSHRIWPVDLSRIDLIESGVDELLHDMAGFDILVNNSSGPPPRNLLDCSAEDFENVFRQQFLAAHVLALRLLPYMKSRGYGRIINVVGTSIKEPIPGLALSSVKSTVENWAKALSKEVGKFGITVNNIMPGPTNTDELKKLIKALAKKEKLSQNKFIERLAQATSVRRIAEPKEIAAAIAFVASEHASFITGSNFSVDGGYLASI